MLLNLSIKNYLLIDQIDLDFKSGFSVITGETGAGKSIIIGAISLLLGKRAEIDVLSDKTKKCILEACFDISKLDLKPIFEENEIDFENETIIRREILPNGKSRAYINDSPVNLNTLKDISKYLIDLHSQHKNLNLLLPEYRLNIIDLIAETEPILVKYCEYFNKYKNASNKLVQAEKELNKIKSDFDYYQFQAKQIEDLNIKTNSELEELEEKSKLLENTEEIKSALGKSINILNENDLSIDSMLMDIKQSLGRITSSYKPAQQTIERIESILIEIRDISEIFGDDIENIEHNPQLLDNINSRIDAINNILTKHNCENITELLEIYNQFKSKIDSTEELENKIIELKTIADNTLIDCKKQADLLSKKRISKFEYFESLIVSMLQELGMPQANFKIQNNISETLSETGIDNIDFLFSANKSMEVQSLEKVASGGEFSRTMLALKTILAKVTKTPTIIFDEIDTGVSGEIAAKMGNIMKKIANDFQVISITHLPQVAVKGENHFKVYKILSETKSETNIKLLSHDERILEIAAMISGEEMSQQAIENAKILLANGGI